MRRIDKDVLARCEHVVRGALRPASVATLLQPQTVPGTAGRQTPHPLFSISSTPTRFVQQTYRVGSATQKVISIGRSGYAAGVGWERWLGRRGHEVGDVIRGAVSSGVPAVGPDA
jgi:hypothetical protein